jgi:hypothetical protein
MDTRNVAYEANVCLITKQALSIIERAPALVLDKFTQLKAQAIRTAAYPNGAVLVEFPANGASPFWQFVGDEALLGEGGIWWPRGIGSLDPFPRKLYELYYTTDYRESLGELDLSIIDPSVISFPSNKYTVSDLLITVGFCNMLKIGKRVLLLDCISDALARVLNRGIVDEGPLRLSSPHCVFYRRFVQFRINVSQSGQDTLNWLILALLDFGYKHHRVVSITIGQEENVEVFNGPLGDVLDKLAFQDGAQ